MLSFARWGAVLFACFMFVGACSISEGTDPGALSDASTGDGGLCEPTACPGKDNECGQRTCTNGACSMAYLPQGPATSAQVPGDCYTYTCDGKGTLARQIDNADIPDDKNPCTIDTCGNGEPKNANGPAGVNCGTGLLCNGIGQCVGCLKPTDCPGIDSECGTRTCSAGGVCGNDFAPVGKALATQVAGDCHTLQCDGNGTAVSVVNGADVPVDANLCTDNLCTLGTPSNPNSAANTACGGGKICNGAGTCVQCLSAAGCPGSDTFCGVRTCTASACGMSFTSAGTPTPTQTTGDCHQNRCTGSGAETNAVDDSDVKIDGNECTDDLCTAGTPSNPNRAARATCNGGGGKVFCNGAGVCVQCTMISDCPLPPEPLCAARTCSAGACGFSYTANGTAVGTQIPGDCHENQCNGSGALTSAVSNSDADDGNACTTDLCNNGVPSHTKVADGTNCGGGKKCANGVCQ